jgi:hypothetical protein
VRHGVRMSSERVSPTRRLKSSSRSVTMAVALTRAVPTTASFW